MRKTISAVVTLCSMLISLLNPLQLFKDFKVHFESSNKVYGVSKFNSPFIQGKVRYIGNFDFDVQSIPTDSENKTHSFCKNLDKLEKRGLSQICKIELA